MKSINTLTLVTLLGCGSNRSIPEPKKGSFREYGIFKTSDSPVTDPLSLADFLFTSPSQRICGCPYGDFTPDNVIPNEYYDIGQVPFEVLIDDSDYVANGVGQNMYHAFSGEPTEDGRKSFFRVGIVFTGAEFSEDFNVLRENWPNKEFELNRHKMKGWKFNQSQVYEIDLKNGEAPIDVYVWNCCHPNQL